MARKKENVVSKGVEYKVELWPLYKVKPLTNNPRRIGKNEYKRLKDRLEERGNHSVIVVDHNNICLSGNQRLKAMEELGWMEAWVMVPKREMTEEERQDVIINSNISSGEFNMDILANEYMEELIIDAGLINKLPDDIDIPGADQILDPKKVEIECEKCGHHQTLILPS
jgi:hypothetical protein